MCLSMTNVISITEISYLLDGVKWMPAVSLRVLI